MPCPLNNTYQRSSFFKWCTSSYYTCSCWGATTQKLLAVISPPILPFEGWAGHYSCASQGLWVTKTGNVNGMLLPVPAKYSSSHSVPFKLCLCAMCSFLLTLSFNGPKHRAVYREIKGPEVLLRGPLRVAFLIGGRALVFKLGGTLVCMIQKIWNCIGRFWENLD